MLEFEKYCSLFGKVAFNEIPINVKMKLKRFSKNLPLISTAKMKIAGFNFRCMAEQFPSSLHHSTFCTRDHTPESPGFNSFEYLMKHKNRKI